LLFLKTYQYTAQRLRMWLPGSTQTLLGRREFVDIVFGSLCTGLHSGFILMSTKYGTTKLFPLVGHRHPGGERHDGMDTWDVTERSRRDVTVADDFRDDGTVVDDVLALHTRQLYMESLLQM